jgi:ribosomal 50S subunit-recycling heat shock protein
VGDVLVFALSGRVIELTVEGLGDRRRPPAEARSLYRLAGDEDPA